MPASRVRYSVYIERVTGTSTLPPRRWPALKVVMYAAAGRTDRSVVSLAFLSPIEARKVRLAEPSGGRARTLKLAEPSRSSLMPSCRWRSPTISSPGEVSSATVTGALLPEPITALVTATVTSLSSPGARKVGTLGAITKSPRTRVRSSKVPMASLATPTAITRTVPLK